MKRTAMSFALVLITSILAPRLSFAQGPQLQLGHLDRLASQAKESVDVNVDPAMLQMAGGVLAGPTDDAAKNLIAGLKGVYVKSLEFESDGMYTQADVDAVRAQLKAPWARVVSVQSQKDRESVEIYSWQEGGQSGGLAILVAEPKELTIVNIVGKIDLSQLAAFGGRFGIPRTIPGVNAKPF